MRAAEVHIASGGLSVSLRDIALGAGIRNNSAVNYHFGDREGLVEAIVLDRTERMETERARRAAGLDEEASLRDLVAALVEPMLTVPSDEGATHYASFLDQVRAHPVIAQGLDDPSRFPATRELLRRISQHLDLTPAARRRRLAALSTALFALAADRERARAENRPACTADEIVNMLLGLLTA